MNTDRKGVWPVRAAWKAAAVGALFLAGCIASDQEPRGGYDGLFSCDSSPSAAGQPADPAPDAVSTHAGPWTWEELALRAGRRSDAMRSGRLEALVARLKASQKVAWRDPEFRFMQRWSDDDGSTWGRKYGTDGGSKESSGKYSDGSGWSRQFGVRLYVPNPFINHYLADQGDATVRASEAKAETEAYGIYTEVKMLCAEYCKARREAELYAERVKLVTQSKLALEDERKNGVARSPFDAINAATRHRSCSLQLAELQRAAASLKRTIAKLAEMPTDDLEIADDSESFPDPAGLSADALAEIAFVRRPDLARAIAERDAAEAGVGAAKAAYIPWFRFVEGSYRRGHDVARSGTLATDDSSWSGGRDRSDDWSLEVAINVPLFTWCGDSVKISRQIRDRAETRVASLYDDVREEIRAALDGYRLAYERDDAQASGKFIAEVTREIDDYAKSEATLESEANRSRMALVDYRLLYNDIHSEKVEAALRLESVLGGPIPSVPSVPADPAAADSAAGASVAGASVTGASVAGASVAGASAAGASVPVDSSSVSSSSIDPANANSASADSSVGESQ